MSGGGESTAPLQEQISIELAAMAENGAIVHEQQISPPESATARRRRTLLSSRSGHNNGPKDPSAQFLQQHYPKQLKLLHPLMDELRENKGDKGQLGNALHTLMEKGPLACYLLVKEVGEYLWNYLA